MNLLTQAHKQRLLDIGYTMTHNGKISQAKSIFDAFLLEDENNATALIGKAFTELVLDNFDESEKILNKVINSNPNDQEAIAMLSLNYFLSGNMEKAKQQAELLQDSKTEAYTLVQDILAEIK